MNNNTTYKQAGVDIDAGAELVERIKPYVKKTLRPEVKSSLGSYAGLFALDLKKYKNPLLVSTTDGVGTKLKLAFELQKFDTVGIDLVAMCVNDLICYGAEPLFFLDYFATGKLNVDQASQAIKGISLALKEVNCALLGGETAEMPGFYSEGEFDLAGFAVGAVDKNHVIDGSQIKEGNRIIGLASSGFHSNGFSLVRRIIADQNIDLKKQFNDFSGPIGKELLTPTLLYVKAVLDLQSKFSLKGLAHITGGGLIENIPRIIPESLTAVVEKQSITVPPLFKFFQQLGNVPENEMWRVCNMGIGFVMIVIESEESEILERLNSLGYAAGTIGTIQKRSTLDTGIKLV